MQSFDRLLQAKRDQHADDDDADLRQEFAKAVNRPRLVNVHRPPVIGFRGLRRFLFVCHAAAPSRAPWRAAARTMSIWADAAGRRWPRLERAGGIAIPPPLPSVALATLTAWRLMTKSSRRAMTSRLFFE